MRLIESAILGLYRRFAIYIIIELASGLRADRSNVNLRNVPCLLGLCPTQASNRDAESRFVKQRRAG